MTKNIFITVFFLIALHGFSQSVDWTTNTNYAWCTSPVLNIEVDSLSNIYAAGTYTDPYSRTNFFLEKRDGNGNVIWKDSITCTGGVSTINLSLDNNYLYLTGSGSKKIDFQGNIQDYNYHRGVRAKYDLNGNVIWVHQDTLLRHENATYKNNTLYVSGFSSENGKYYLAGYDNNGIKKWIKYFNKQICDFHVFNDSSYVMRVGNGASYDPDSVMKYDGDGVFLWSAELPGYGTGLTGDYRGNCYVSGFFTTGNYLAKLNTAGQWLWTNYNYPNGVRHIAADKELDYVYSGGNDSNNKAWLSIYDTLGNVIRGVQLGDYTICYNGGESIHRNGQEYYVGGWNTYPGCRIGFIAKITDANIFTEINNIESNSILNVFPNPTKESFQILYTASEKVKLQLNIFNSAGETVYSERIPEFQGEYKKTIDLSTKSKGIYFIEIIADGKRSVKKIVLN